MPKRKQAREVEAGRPELEEGVCDSRVFELGEEKRNIGTTDLKSVSLTTAPPPYLRVCMSLTSAAREI